MKRYLYIVSILPSILIVSISFSLLIGRLYVQKSSSMNPSIINNDRIFILKSKNIQRFDIICFNFTQDGKTFPILKRVIAFSGEKILISYGEIRINDKIIKLPSDIDVQNLLGSDLNPIKFGSPYNYIVPPGELFIMGDNTKDSYDSRYYGGVPITMIIGKAAWILRFLK